MKTSGQPSLLRICVLILMFLSYTDTYVFSKPRGGQVVSGTASFTQDGNLTVIAAGNRSIINYQSFDIGKNETVQFVQPGAHATVLNRVLTPDPTNIFGHLEANGIVIISNPYGVFFQNGSVVNVGGLIAGAGKISDADFTAGKIHFTDLTGDVRNDGVIAADNRIALMGANVVNTGSAVAAHGVAMMVSGADVYVGDKNGNIFVQANGKALKAAAAAAGGAGGASAGSVTNSGTVAAPRVLLGAGDMYSTAIVNSGLLQGRAVAVNAGKNGSATIGGTLDASSAHNPTAAGTGGSIDVLGGTVALQGATLDASGSAGGGTVRVGGDFHGDGALAHAAITTVDAASTIRADATGTTGNGGSVVLWSDRATDFLGQITARGGAAGGDGGAVEVSSHGGLGYNGLVDATAPNGKVGSLLLDPTNIEITTGGVADVGFVANPVLNANTNTGAGDKLSITQASLQTTAAAINLTATNDIRIDSLSGNTLALMGTADATFLAGGNGGTGSLVMADTTQSISNPGHGISITANGASTANGINSLVATNAGAAIAVGALNTANATLGTNGGAVSLNITGATTAPVRVGNITTTSSNGDAGMITVGGATFAGNINAGALNSQSTGTGAVGGGAVGAGGPVKLDTTGTVKLTGVTAVGPPAVPGSVATSSAGGAAGSILIGTLAVPASITTSDVLTAQSAAGNGGAVTLNSTGAVTIGGAVNTTSSNAAGGAIGIAAGGNVQTGNLNAGSAVSTAAANGVGTVSVTTTAGTIAVNNVTTSSASGPGGSITLGNAVAAGVTAGTAGAPPVGGALTSKGTTTGGAVSLVAAGPLTVYGTIDSSTTGTGKGGDVTLNTASTVAATVTDVTTAGITTTSTGGVGGAVTTTRNSAGANYPTDITVGTINTTGTGATNGGPVTLQTTGALTLATATTSLTGNTVFSSNTASNTAAPATPLAFTTNGYNFSLTLNATAINASQVTDTPHDLTLASTTGININEATVTTTGSQTYTGNVTLTATGNAVTLRAGTTDPAGAISFGGTLDDNASGGHALTLTPGSGGGTTFAGAVGGTPLASLTALSRSTTVGATTTTTNDQPVTIKDVAITTSGAQTYGSLTLVAAGTGTTTLTGTDITIGTTAAPGAVTGAAQGLTVAASGTATFGAITGAGVVSFTGTGATALKGAIGATTLSVSNGTGVTLSGGTVTTSAAGGQTYSEPVALGADTTLTATNGTATFGSTVDGVHALTVNADGTTTFNGNVGGGVGTALTSLNVSNGGTDFKLTSGVAPLTVTTTGTDATTANGQTYHGAVTLESDVTLSASAAPVGFGSTVGSSVTPRALTVTGGLTTFGGVVGGTSTTATAAPALASLTVTNAAKLNAASVTTTGSQSYGSLTLGGTGATTLASTGTTGTTNISSGTLAGNGSALTIDVDAAGGTSTFAGISGVGALQFNVDGALQLNGAITSTSSLLVTGGTGVTLAAGGTAVSTSGEQEYNEPLTLTANTILTGQGTMANGGIALLFDKSVSGAAYTLTLTNTPSGVVGVKSDTTFSGAVGTLAGLTTSATGTTNINGGSVTTVGATGQTYNGPVVLGIPGATTTAPLTTTLSATGAGANILFKSTVDGNVAGTQGLIVNATGNETFIADVGTAALASLTTDNGGSLGGSAVFGGTGTVAPVTVTTTGLQSYNDPVVLGAATVLNAGSIALGSTIDGSTNQYDLTLGIGSDITLSAGTDVGTGAGRISGVLHNIGNFKSDGAGNVFVKTEFETYGSQEFDDHAFLNTNAEFRSDNNSAVSFAAVDSNSTGYYILSTVTTGTTTFGGQAGNTRPLLGVMTSGPTAFNYNGVAVQTLNTGTNVTNGNGAQSYGGAVTLQQDTTLSSTFAAPATVGGSIAFASAVDGAHALALNTTGATSFTGAVGTGSAGSALSSLTIGGNSTAGTTISGGAVKTTGTQTYGSPLTIATNNLTLTSTGTGAATSAITFNSTIGGPFTLTTATSGGNTVFGAASTNSTVPGALLTGLTTSANGTTIFNNSTFTTNGTQNYQGAAVVQSSTRALSLTASSGNINFGSTLGSNANGTNSTDLTLMANAAGASVTFTGAVGGGAVAPSTTALNSLTVTSPTINIVGGEVNTVSTAPRGTPNDGKQVYNGSVILKNDTTFTGSLATFNGGITETTPGTYNLTLNLSTQVTLPGTAPLSQVKDFASIGSGGVLINNNISTYGSQTYSGGAVVISGDATVPATVVLTAGTGVAGSSININTTLNDSADFTHGLTLTTGTGGSVNIGGAIGGTHPFLTLTAKTLTDNTTPEPVTINAQTVAAGTQSYGTLTLGGTGATTLTSTRANGAISSGTVSGGVNGHAFNVNVTGTGGSSTFADIGDTGGAVNFEVAGIATFSGAITASSFTLGATTVGTSGVFGGGGVTTTLGQTYGEQVYLNAPTTTLADTGGGTISLKNVDSYTATPVALTVNTAGLTVFGGTVGAVNALSGVTTDYEGMSDQGTQLNGGGITTTGAQLYSDDVTLGATTALSAGSGAVTFGRTLQSVGMTTPQALTITTTGTTTFGGVVGGTPGAVLTGVTTAPALASLKVLGGGAVDINGDSITTVSGATGVQQYTGPIVLGAPTTTLQGYSATFNGAITSAATAGAPFNLTLDFFGAETLPSGTIAGGIRDLLVNGPGGVSLAGVVTTRGNQHFLNGVVTLTGDTVLTAGSTIASGSITLDSNVVDGTPGAHALTLVTGSAGSVAINAPIGTATDGTSAALGSLKATDSSTTVGGVTTTATEKVTIAATSVTTAGSQNYGTLTLGGTGLTTLVSTATTGATGINSGAVTAGGNPLTINVASVSGNSTIGSISGAGALDATIGGTINFSGIGATTVNVAAKGAANFNGTVGLGGAFLSNGTGTTTFNAPVTADSLTVKNGSGVTFNAGTIATVNGQTYSEPALVASTTSLTDAATLSLAKVDSATATAEALTTSAPTTIFGGTVGMTHPLSSLTTGGGITQINGGSIATLGPQMYNDAVTLGATTALTAGTGAVTFALTLGSAGFPQALTISTTGVTTFSGQVGGAPGNPGTDITTAPALASLKTTGGEVDIKTGVTTITTTGGVQNYGGPVKLIGNATLEGYALTLGAGLSGQTGTYSLTLDFSAQTTLPGGIVGLNSFTSVGFGGVLLSGGTLSTTGNQTYSNGSVAVAADTTLTSTAGSLNFNTPISGAAALTLNATGAGGAVNFNMAATAQGGVSLASLTTTGAVVFNEAGASAAQPDVVTTGAQTYNSGAVTLDRDTFLTSTGTAATGAISFGTSTATAATIDSMLGTARSLTLNTLGTQTFYGLIGSATNTQTGATGALGGLTTGTGPTVFNMIIPAGAPAGVRVAGPLQVNGPTTFDVGNSSLAQPSILTLGALGTQTYVGVVTLGSAADPNVRTVINSATTETGGVFAGGQSITFDTDIVVGSAAGTPGLDVRAGLGSAEFDGSINTTGDFAPGTANVAFHGNVGTPANPLGAFTVLPNDPSDPTMFDIDINGGVVTTLNGSQLYMYPTVLSKNTVLNAGTAGGAPQNVTFGGPLNGSNQSTGAPYALAVNVNGGGLITFDGVVGGLIPLASLTTGNIGSAFGTTVFRMPLPLAGTGLGGVNVMGAVTINTNADFETAAVLGVTGPTILSGVSYHGVAGTGTQTYGSATTPGAVVTLGQNTILRDLVAGNVTFNGQINAKTAGGAFLSVNSAGDEIFGQLVGNMFTLSTLSTDDLGPVGGTTQFKMNLTQAGAVAGVRLDGALDVNDGVAFNATGGATLPTILSGGAQTYALAGTVQQGTVLTAGGGNITFAGALDSGAAPSDLTVNTPGNEVFNGLVGASSPLASLTTDATGTVGGSTRFVLALPATGVAAGVGGVNVTGGITLNDRVFFQVTNTTAVHPSVVSGGTQTYQEGAVLGATTILTSSGASLLFNSTVDSDDPTTPRDLITNTPTVGSVTTFAQTVGGAAALASLTSSGRGTTQINGGITANANTIRTTGSQEYLQAVTLGNDTLLNAGGNVDFGNVASGNLSASLDGTHSLTVDAAAASFEAVGNNAPLVNLTVNAGATSFDYVSAGAPGVSLAGTLTLNSPAVFNGAGAGNIVFVRTGVTVAGVTAASGQDFIGAVTFSGSGTFTDLKSGAISFERAVDAFSTLGLSGLTVSTGGTISFLGPVGMTTPLTSLTTSNLGLATGRTVISGGSITTINKGTVGATGAQTFNDAVFLGADATLASTATTGVAAGGDVTFALTIDSLSTARALTVNTSGQTIFSGAVGLGDALASVTTDAPGDTQLNGGSVTTVNFQNYNDAVTLGAATTLGSTNNGNIAFAKTLDSATAGTPETLAVNTGGATIFGGAVGAANALASVTTDAPGSTEFNGGSVTTTGAQTYKDASILGAGAVLTSTANGALTFNGTVDGAFALSLRTGGLTSFTRPVGNTVALASLTTDAAGSTQFSMPVGSVAGVVVNGPVAINDPVSFAATGASLTVPTILTTGNGSQTYAGQVSLGTNTFLVSAAGGSPFTGGGAVAFTSPAGIGSTGGNDLYVRAGVGAATIKASVNANTVDLGGAAVTVAGPVTLPGTVSIEPNSGIGGSILFNGGSITTVGAQVYNASFVLGGNTVLVTTGGGNITFNAALDGAFNLTLNSTGNERFNGQVGGTTPLASLTTDDPAAVAPGGNVIFAFVGTTASPSVRTTGAQTYNDAALLRADTVLASTAGTVAFNSTVDGAQALTVNAAGDEVFNGRVGGTTALTSLVTDDPAGSISGGHVIFNIANSTTASPGVTTTGAQTFNDAALLATNTVLASSGGGTIKFNSTVDGAQALTINTAGNEVFNGRVGGTTALTSLVTDDPAANTTGGSVVFNVAGTGRSVTTTGAQTYNDAATLGANTMLASTGNGAVTFNSTVDGAQALTINTGGLLTLGAPVGGGTPLAGLTTLGGGAIALNARTVNTTGLQSYGGVVTLGADTTLTSSVGTGGITFLTTLDSDATPRALTLNAAGDETFTGRVGGINPLASLVTDATGAGGHVIFAVAGGSTTAAPAVTTLGAQTYNDAALLQTGTVLASTQGGALTFNSTVDGAQALTVNTAGDTMFNGALGATTALASLLTNDPAAAIAGGRVLFNVAGSTIAAPSVRTTGVQTFYNALVMLADTVLTSTQGGTLTFNSTVDGAQALSLNSSGDEVFNARVGGVGTGLASLVTDADAANRGGRTMFGFVGTNAAPSVTTTGAQTFNDAGSLRADTVLTSTAGTITFNSTVDGAQALTVNAAGDEVFRGAVGGNRALNSLLTDDDPNVRGGSVVFDFAGSSGTPSVRTTGVQTYRDAATVGATTFLTSTNGAALTFHSTIDGAADLTLSTTGLTTFNDAVGGTTPLASLTVAGGGAVALDAGSVATTGGQEYSGAVTLVRDATFTSGGVTFDSTLDGGQNATFVNPTGTTTFGAAVGGTVPLNTLTLADGSDAVIAGGGVTTLNLQTYGGHVEVSRADGGVTTLTAVNNTVLGNGSQGNNLVFKQNVDVDSGSLRVVGYRILAEPDSDINVAGAGSLDLEASNTLILQGGSYGSETGAVVLNDPDNAAYPDTASRATIFLTNPGRTVFHGGSFDMGYLQNMFSRGSVAITVPGGTATLSDIAANGTLTVQAAQIVLRARDADGTRGAVGGGTDDGLNFVARTSISFGNSPIRYDNTHSGNDVANFVTSAGQVTVNRDTARGISIFQDPTLANTFAQAGGGGLSDDNFDTFEFPFQPISGGTQTIDTAAALSGALPDQKPLDVAVDITISASQLEELLKLGIHPRKAQKQERISLASKRALFAQLVDGLDKDNYGRLQPIKGGISTLVPSDYVVVVDRMSEHEVQDILTAFETLYGKNKEKVPPIGEAFNTAFNDYSTEKQTADPAGYAPYIAAHPGKYPDVDKAVKGFDNLFGYIEHLGLTTKEQAKAKEHIASDLQVSGVSADDMVKTIDTLRTKIPKEQKAPSTKLPPSAPAGNPAPGATSPGQPEQKKGTPPLKTARHARPVTADRAHELAGL